MLPKLQFFLPQHLLSTFAGSLANCRIPWIKNRLIQYFLSKYSVNLEEALEPDPFQYTNFNEFFTRALDPSKRSIATGIHDLISPADGYINQIGQINTDRILQAKDHDFSVQTLLGGSEERATHFKEGSFVTIYLAPENYHRVHMPLDGYLSDMIYVPGQLFSVNFKTAKGIPNLFARNERVIAYFDTSIGKVALVFIGAMIVGSIETVWSGTITPPRKKSIQRWYYSDRIYLRRGEEAGRFKLGSTVIILFERDKVTWDPTLTPTHPIKMGQSLGIFKPDRW